MQCSVWQARQRIENYTQQLRQTRDNNEVLERYARVQAELQETEAKLAELQGRLNHARGQMEEVRVDDGTHARWSSTMCVIREVCFGGNTAIATFHRRCAHSRREVEW